MSQKNIELLIAGAYDPDDYCFENYSKLLSHKNNSQLMHVRCRTAAQAYLFKYWLKNNLSAPREIEPFKASLFTSVEDALNASKHQLQVRQQHLAKVQHDLCQRFINLSDDINNVYTPFFERMLKYRVVIEENLALRKLACMQRYWSQSFSDVVDKANRMEFIATHYLDATEKQLQLSHHKVVLPAIKKIQVRIKRTQTLRLKSVECRRNAIGIKKHQFQSMLIKHITAAMSCLKAISHLYAEMAEMSEKPEGHTCLIAAAPTIKRTVLMNFLAVDGAIQDVNTEAFSHSNKTVWDEEKIGSAELDALKDCYQKQLLPIINQAENRAKAAIMLSSLAKESLNYILRDS